MRTTPSRTIPPTSWALANGIREAGALTLIAAMGFPT